MSDKHAVRWAQRPLRRAMDTQWSKWHWANGPDTTICGQVIKIGLHIDCPLFPETDNRPEVVECYYCRKALERGA